MSVKRRKIRFETILRHFFQTVIVMAMTGIFVTAYINWMNSDNTFQLSELIIDGIDYFQEEEIVDQGGIKDLVNIRNLSLESVQAKLETNPFLEQVDIHKTFPGKLHLKIIEKKPIALLNVQGALLCLDRDGLVLPTRPGRLYHLPVISGKFECEIEAGVHAGGDAVIEGLNFIRTILSDRPDIYENISEIVVGHDKGMLLYTNKLGIPVWFGKGEMQEKVRYFEAIYQELTTNHQFKQVKYIDLRYTNQVILGMRS
ncbi:cell division protein FtsQ/DivIB [bacterium]|nr:cell division protein FtsQ/DivIB [bacterium]